jgi:hypothetical protein
MNILELTLLLLVTSALLNALNAQAPKKTIAPKKAAPVITHQPKLPLCLAARRALPPIAKKILLKNCQQL